MPSSLELELTGLVETLLFNGIRVLDFWVHPEDTTLKTLESCGWTIDVLPSLDVPRGTFEFRARRGH